MKKSIVTKKETREETWTQREIWVVPFNEPQRQWEDFLKLKESVNNIRRGLFQRLHALQDQVAALEEEVTFLRGEEKKSPLSLMG